MFGNNENAATLERNCVAEKMMSRDSIFGEVKVGVRLFVFFGLMSKAANYWNDTFARKQVEFVANAKLSVLIPSLSLLN